MICPKFLCFEAEHLKRENFVRFRFIYYWEACTASRRCLPGFPFR